MAERGQKRPVREFASQQPQGLNLVDVLTIVAVVVVLIVLLRATLQTQGYTLSRQWSWVSTTGGRIAAELFTSPRPPAPGAISEAHGAHAIKVSASPDHARFRKTPLTSAADRRTITPSPSVEPESPWAKSDEVGPGEPG